MPVAATPAPLAALLRAIVALVIVALAPAATAMPPPVGAMLPESVLLTRVRAPVATRMAPPTPANKSAEFPEKVLFKTETVPASAKRAAPLDPVLPLNE